MNNAVQARSVNSVYWITDIVYLRVATDCKAGMVTSIQINGSGELLYGITWSDKHSWHYAIELSDQYIPDFSKQ